ncbi:hypothetical protein V8B55DRAFT_1343398, partial [Mucor lusitanicus]
KWINKRVFSKLHHKFEKGNNFFELSIIVHGCIELLAVGGLVTIKGTPVDAFLGSSVKPLKKAMTIDGDRLTSSIYIRNQQQAVVATTRLLRQYYKVDSCNLWSFHSKQMFDVGFFPVSPANVDAHPSVSSLALKLQSFIISSFATRQVDQENLHLLLLKVKDDNAFLKKSIKVDGFNGDSFSALHNTMDQTGKWKDTMKMLKMLEAGEISLGRSKKEIIENKKMALSVGQRGFFKALSDINDKNAKIAKSKMVLLE